MVAPTSCSLSQFDASDQLAEAARRTAANLGEGRFF